MTGTGSLPRRPILAFAAFVVIALFSLYQSLGLLARVVSGREQPSFDQEFAALGARLDALEPHLPEHGTLGYIHLDDYPPESMVPVKAFMYTQNRLVPRVLEMSLGRDLVVADHPSAESRSQREAAVRPYELNIVRDVGNGLMLLEPAQGE
jgi:hypothetical protein